jgi:NADP-dependent 3-hydroxy acid dehydrogenase YdfG
MTLSLDGQIALVTGASSGIGEATAMALAAAGATVAVCARRRERLEALVRRIEAAGGRALALPGDVADEAVAAALVEQVIAHFGRLDILVNSAGIVQAGGIAGADTAEYRRVFEVNLLATLYTCRAALGPMKRQGSGDIVNVSSLAARKSGPGFNAYSASKHALNAMTDGLRQEVGGSGIRVTILMPGATSTEVADAMEDPVQRAAMQAHVAKEGALAPVDVAGTILFLLSLPRRACVSELSIRPTIDTTA